MVYLRVVRQFSVCMTALSKAQIMRRTLELVKNTLKMRLEKYSRPNLGYSSNIFLEVMRRYTDTLSQDNPSSGQDLIARRRRSVNDLNSMFGAIFSSFQIYH
jgi:hypothetical protein